MAAKIPCLLSPSSKSHSFRSNRRVASPLSRFFTTVAKSSSEDDYLDFSTLHSLNANAVKAYASNPLFGTFRHDKFEWMTYEEFGKRVDLCRALLKDVGKLKCLSVRLFCGWHFALYGCSSFESVLYWKFSDVCLLWPTASHYPIMSCSSRCSHLLSGVTPHSTVGIISNNRHEWATVAAATYSLNATLVPMYEGEHEFHNRLRLSCRNINGVIINCCFLFCRKYWLLKQPNSPQTGHTF